MKSRANLKVLLGPMTAIVTCVAMMVMFVTVVVAVLASLAAFAAAVAAVVTAYVKRDTWTLPAYRWARDRTGQWRVTPWAGNTDTAAAQEETPV